MVKLKNFDESKLGEYTVDEINEFINEIELTRSVIREKLTAEMAEKVKDDRFDAFSFWGQRTLKKIAKKYDGALAGADVYMAIMKTELARREALENTSSYTGKSIAKQKEISEEEFLQKEHDKTWSYRSKIE
jgi:hypothetical protein